MPIPTAWELKNENPCYRRVGAKERCCKNQQISKVRKCALGKSTEFLQTSTRFLLDMCFWGAVGYLKFLPLLLLLSFDHLNRTHLGALNWPDKRIVAPAKGWDKQGNPEDKKGEWGIQ